MEEWKEYKIGDIAKTNISQYSLSENWKAIQYLDTGSITKNHISSIEEYFDNNDLPSRARRKVKHGDIVYSCVRPNLCHYGYMDNPPSNLLVSTGFAVITAASNLADARYLYYFLTQNNIVQSLHAIGEQAASTYPSIKPSDIEDLSISLPPLLIQRKIVAILKSLDDKIEINRRINENLEQQAQALFKSWFVDFEPFRDQPFVESELGRIPKGWRVYNLSDFLPVITGKKDANVAKGGDYPFFSCSQDIAWTDDYSFSGSAILVAGNGDFNVKMYTGQFEAYQRTYVLIPRNSSYTAWLYYAVKYNLDKITSAARGSVIKFITKRNLSDFKFAAPKDLDDFELIRTFDAIRNKVASNEEQNRDLSSLRDTLLPRLMSGELKVQEIEESL